MGSVTRRPLVPIWEFSAEGYMLEVNRRVLHPLGLALGTDGNNPPNLVVYDSRDDPEGVIFDPMDGPRIAKAVNVDRLWAEREPARIAALGYMMQPVPGEQRADEPLLGLATTDELLTELQARVDGSTNIGKVLVGIRHELTDEQLAYRTVGS